MHTKDRLAQELRDLGLTAMADKAATGFYDDYLSPVAAPLVMLSVTLGEEAEKDKKNADKITALRKRVQNGEFDATAEESDAWHASDDGKATVAALTEKPSPL